MAEPVNKIHSLMLWAAEIYEAAYGVECVVKEIEELTGYIDNLGGISLIPGVPSVSEIWDCVVKAREEKIHDVLAKLDRFDALSKRGELFPQWAVLGDEESSAGHKLMTGWRLAVDLARFYNEGDGNSYRERLLEVLTSDRLDDLEKRAASVVDGLALYERYETGTVVEGTVYASSKTKALIELPGYRLGSVLAQDFSWGDDPKPPERGTKVNVVVLGSSPNSWQVVPLGMKQCFTDPSIKADVNALAKS